MPLACLLLSSNLSAYTFTQASNLLSSFSYAFVAGVTDSILLPSVVTSAIKNNIVLNNFKDLKTHLATIMATSNLYTSIDSAYYDLNNYINILSGQASGICSTSYDGQIDIAEITLQALSFKINTALQSLS